MGKLGIKDIIALASAGYKPSDVKELLNIEAQAEEKKTDPAPSSEENAPSEQPPTENGQKDVSQDQAGSENKEDNVDYKLKYEETLKELQKLQKENVRADQSKNIEKPKELSEILAEIM